MTQKDYIALAAAIRQARNRVPQSAPTEIFESFQEGIDLAVDELVDVLELDNERFDEAKFRQAAAL